VAARDWWLTRISRAPFSREGSLGDCRLPEPALIGAIKSQRRALAQPVFDLRDCHELQSTTPNPPHFRSDVLIEEVPTASKRLRGRDTASAPGAEGGELDLAYASAPPIFWRELTFVCRARANTRSCIQLRQIPPSAGGQSRD
jgi:hypothetical protein